MKKVVMKFGGTSVASGENIRHIANLIANYVGQGYAIVTVVSASKGVTDELVEASKQAKNRNQDYIYKFKQKIVEKHLATARKAVGSKLILEEVERVIGATVDELEKVLTGIVYLGELTLKSKDYVLSFGEKL